MANIPYPEQYDDSFMNIFKRIIDELNAKGYTYDQAIEYANQILDEAKQTNSMNEDVQNQINNIVAGVADPNSEIAQARGEYSLLNERMMFFDSEISELESKKVDRQYVSQYVDAYVGDKIGLKQGRQAIQEAFDDVNNVILNGAMLSEWNLVGTSSDGLVSNNNGKVLFDLNAGGMRGVAKTGNFDYSIYNNFNMWVKSHPDHLMNVRFTINAPDTNNQFTLSGDYIMDQIKLTGIEGTNIGVSKADFEKKGNPDWSNVTQILITVFASNNSDLFFELSDLKLQKGKHTKGKVIIRLDDGNLSDYTNAFRIMKEHNLVGTLVINPGSVGGFGKITIPQLLEMQTWGWDVSSHSWVHDNFENTSYQKAYNNLRATQTWLKENGFVKGARFHAYPYHGQNTEVMKAANDLYNLNNSGPLGHESLPFGNENNLRWLAGSRKTFSQLKKYVDDCMAHNTLAIITFHKILENADTPNFDTELSEFEQFIEYLAQQDIDTMTYTDLLELKGIALR